MSRDDVFITYQSSFPPRSEGVADRAIVAHSVEGAGDVRPVHLSCPGLTAPGIVGNLNFPDPRQAGLSPADHVALTNLRVVKVKIDAKAWSVDS